MNILLANSKSGAFFQIANGWKNAFRVGGHRADLWDGTDNMWLDYKPDIYIGCAAWTQNFSRLRKNTRIALHVDPLSNEVIQAPGGPPIKATQNHVKWAVSQKPDFVFGYGLQEDMERYWSHWKTKHGFRLVGSPNAADSTIYKETSPDQAHSCDVGWVGGYWPYKAINLNKYLLPVVKKFKSIWYGWSGPKGMWHGEAKQDQVLKLFNSSKICPSVVEPHTTTHGIDIPERMFKVSACGALTVLDPFRGIHRYFPEESIVLAKDPQHYMQLCERFISMDCENRKKQADKMKREVLLNHTYFNRVQVFLNAFGYKEEAEKYDDIIKSQVLDLYHP